MELLVQSQYSRTSCSHTTVLTDPTKDLENLKEMHKCDKNPSDRLKGQDCSLELPISEIIEESPIKVLSSINSNNIYTKYIKTDTETECFGRSTQGNSVGFYNFS